VRLHVQLSRGRPSRGQARDGIGTFPTPGVSFSTRASTTWITGTSSGVSAPPTTTTFASSPGDFQAVVPAGGDVDVVVVASGPSGQVNWRDNDVTWYWKDLSDHRFGAAGSILTYNWRAARDHARHFNALDVTLRGLEYALTQTGIADELADSIFHKVSVIPRWSGTGGTTLPLGLASHIWVGWDDDIFDDSVMLHEYGHHLERMNGTYAAWPASQDGCYATADLGICAARAS
jgi:hypothetical protein